MEKSDFSELEGIGFSENWSEVEETVNEASIATLERLEDLFSG